MKSFQTEVIKANGTPHVTRLKFLFRADGYMPLLHTRSRSAFCYSAAILVACLTLWTSSLSAQEAGSIELGVYADVVHYAEFIGSPSGAQTAQVRDGWGYGIRVGVFLLPELRLEAAGSKDDPRLEPALPFLPKLRHLQLQGRLLFSPWQGHRVQVFVGPGVTYDEFGTRVSASIHQVNFVLTQGVNARLVGHSTMARAEFWIQPVGNTLARSGAQLGVSIVANPFSRRHMTELGSYHHHFGPGPTTAQ